MSQPSWIGQTLDGRYRIEELLGSGGMSSVYKGSDPNLRRAVAIKLIHPHLSREPEFVSRFEEEASAVARLKHPNVIKVFDFNNDGETYYMVMEYIQGETLEDQLIALQAKKQRMAAVETLRIATKISAALHYAHQRQMIHRDVKPANIMLDEQGHPILMDFGIAKIIGGKVQTATGAIIGTALYMSPEQIQGQQADARADIYSLGVVLFEMIAGQPPFGGDSAMTIMMKHVNDPIPNLQELNPETSPTVRGIIEKALDKNPQQRFQSAGEMEQALQAVLDSAPAAFYEATMLEQPLPPDGGTVLEETPQAAPARAPVLQDLPPVPVQTAAGPSNLSRIITIAGGFVVVLLLLLGGVVFLGNRNQTSPTVESTALPTATPATVSPTDLPPTEQALPTLIPPVGSSNIYIEYILDGSGSMLEFLGSRTKLAIAQEVLSERVRTLPPGVNVGLRVYGHNVPFQQTEDSCADIELVVPLQPGGGEQIIDWLTDMQAQGMTPMSESIRLASEDFTFQPDRRNVIVLISDGIETCGEAPADVVLRLQELGIDFNIHVIGLNVDAATRSQLSRIADVAQGTYYDATSEEDLSNALGSINETVVQPLPATAVPSPTPFPQANVDTTNEGQVSASTTFSGFPPSLATDGDFGTSWFSTGPEAGGAPSVFLWTGQQDDFIASITVTSNDFNYEPAFRTGFGFGSVIVQVLDFSENVLFEQTVSLPGTPDPQLIVNPNVVGRSVRLLFSGHESLECGGFSELEIGVYREGA